MNSTLKSLLFWAALVVIAVVVYNVSTKLQNTDHQINFSEFMSSVKAGGVESVIITGQEITGTNKEHETFHTYAPAQYEGLANELLQGGVVIKAKAETASPWASILYSWAPLLLMLGFYIFFMRQVQSGGNKALSFGKSKAKLSSSSQKQAAS